MSLHEKSTIKHKQDDEVYTSADLADRLRARGWQLPMEATEASGFHH